MQSYGLLRQLLLPYIFNSFSFVRDLDLCREELFEPNFSFTPIPRTAFSRFSHFKIDIDLLWPYAAASILFAASQQLFFSSVFPEKKKLHSKHIL
jgi:hypothetical protein